MALAMIVGCQPGSTSDPGATVKQTNAGQGTEPTSTQAAMPLATNSRVRYAPCSEGLPRDKVAMWKCDPIFADVNGDGLMDLAANPRLGKGPKVWLGNGRGDWTDASSGLDPGMSSCGGGVGFADFNKDGFLDLAVGDHCQGLFVYLGDGGGHWSMVTKGLFPIDLAVDGGNDGSAYTGVEDMDIADFNRDGNLDLLAGSSDFGGINLYFGDGTGAGWTRATDTNLPPHGWANRVIATDIDKDGLVDVVASFSEGVRIWKGNGEGQFTDASNGMQENLVQGWFQGLAVGDINEDGLTDIAVAHWMDGPDIYYQQPDASWKRSETVFPQMKGGGYGLALSDLDNDKHLDIVVTGRLATGDAGAGLTRGVYALLGNGKGGFTYAANSGLPETGMLFNWGCSTGDINGDKLPDIVAGSGGSVESAPGRTDPIYPERLVVWCSQPVQ